MGCDAELTRRTRGLSHTEMVKFAEQANFRRVLWQMEQAVCKLFEQVVERESVLQELPDHTSPSWSVISERWKHD